ncbi:MAG: 2-polyprenyl-3-methyl-5-hydroxy-6-metoxy-1,4-benzoquinol methylase [Psychroserpens sp.]|jgi:2-polyprenyl-3-methyl-5-hydroxy-6-metoxy-1,4-benzoquinol methylase
MGVEKKAAYYNKKFTLQDEYRDNYKNSWYYVQWTQIIQLLKKIENPQILEIGCATGQLAQYLYDQNYQNYNGFDFSEVAVEHAKKYIPQIFFVGNALDAKNYNLNYNTVICTEVLEHIKEDIKVIKNIKVNTSIIFSIPNFDEISHVRWFTSERQIKKRYYRVINIEQIIQVGNIYIVKGIRSDFHPNSIQKILASREQINTQSIIKRVKHKVKNIFKLKFI